MKEQKTTYKTHWHSFWFGFVSALAITLFLLLVAVISGAISLNGTKTKKVAVTPQENIDNEPQQSQTLSDVLQQFNINEEEIKKCVQEKRYANVVQKDIDSGTKAGVRGTPHSFVLFEDKVYEIPGAQEEDGMRAFFDDLLAGRKPRAKDISATTDLAPVNDEDWIRGDDDARITVITYSDVDCPFCKKFNKSITDMMADYKDDVRWVFRHMPIDNLHPQAREKAETAECVGEIGGAEAFWTYVDALFAQNE